MSEINPVEIVSDSDDYESENEEEKDEWVDLRNHPDYEINTKYPYSIRKKSNKYIIKEHENKQGYIACRIDGIVRMKHRILAEQFIENDDPEHKVQIDHINHIRSDNHLNNIRWCTISENVRNKAAYNGVKVEYVDELPEDAIKIKLYKGIEFDNYFYSKSTQKCYYDNDVKIRVLIYHYSEYGYKYIRVRDIENKDRSIYIDAWLRLECIE